jgi:hypothetical protein
MRHFGRPPFPDVIPLYYRQYLPVKQFLAYRIQPFVFYHFFPPPLFYRSLLDMSTFAHSVYIDYYLLHNLGGSRTKTFDDFGMWDYARELKEKGVVRHIGFSLHDTAQALDHPR